MNDHHREPADDVRMRGFARRQTVEAALAWLDAHAGPLGAEAVPLRTAAGRVLATSVASEVDVPGFDRATMDGYAVVAESTEGATSYNPLPLTIVGFLQLGIGAALAPTGHRIAGALGMMFWGTFLRVVVGLHATWLVNSATHMFGSRRFETKDDSRNSWWVALLTGGEGWHNNHHAHPVSARHGLAWYELDINYYGIWFLSKIGLAEKVQVAKFDPKNPKPAGV